MDNNIYINLLIEDFTQRILCEDIKPSIAWAMIKAQYEERTTEDEELWVYFGAAHYRPNISHLKSEDISMEIKSTDTITTLWDKFDHCIYRVKEG